MSLLNPASTSAPPPATPPTTPAPTSTPTPNPTPAFLASLLTTQHRYHASLSARHHPHLHIPPLTLHTLSQHTALRSTNTSPTHFGPVLTRLIVALLDQCLALLPYEAAGVETPTGEVFEGCSVAGGVVGVSVMRAGEAFEGPLRERVPGVVVGKLLVQRDEASPGKQAHMFYSKMPQASAGVTVLLCDVMLATGNSLCVAIEHLLGCGYELRQIIVLTLIGCPEGVEQVMTRYAGVTLCCQWVDRGLNEHKYIVPGVGDAGDRYFNTLTK